MKFIKVRTNYFVTLINIEKIESVYEYTKNDREVEKPEQWLTIITHDECVHDIPNFTLQQFENCILNLSRTEVRENQIIDLTGDA
jgi:hypothetical protein